MQSVSAGGTGVYLDYQLCEMFAIQVASTRVSGCAKCERRGNRGGLGLSTLS